MTSPSETRAPGEPTLPPAKMHLVRPTEPVVGRVLASEQCTAKKASGFVRHIEIDIAGTPLEGSFRAGQSFGVIPPGTDENGRPHRVRLYSLACPTSGEDGRGRIISTTVKRTIEERFDTGALHLGVASNFLCDRKPGDEVLLSGPNGKRFLLPEKPEDHDYVFVATGTGVAPYRGMLADLEAGGFPSRTALVMGVPYRTDLLYHDHLASLEARTPSFRYCTAISREGEREYVQDRILAQRDYFADLLSSDRTLLYICGVAGMEIGVIQALARILSPGALEGFIRPDPGIAGEPDSWTRRMLHKDIILTRRVMMEVY